MISVNKLTSRFLQNALKQGAFLKVRVEGSCMEPVIKPGSFVKVERLDGLRVGSVVLLKDHRKRYLVHRVVCMNADSVVTCGDRNHFVDYPVPYSSVLGVIRSVSEKNQAYSTPEIIVYISPEVDMASVCPKIPANISVAKVSNLPALLKDLWAENYYIILVHRGAKRKFHSVPYHISKMAVFIGFQPAEYAMTNGSTISLKDVNLVARTKDDWWQSSTINEDLNYLKGFKDGRAIRWLG